MDIGTIGTLLGGLGLGSAVGQYATSGSQRRTTRAAVLSAIEECESARWAGSPPRPDFRVAMRQLETACLIARVPQQIVDQYRVLAWAGYWLSQESWEDYPDEQEGGGINAVLAGFVRGAAIDLTRVVWSPWLARIRLGRRVVARQNRVDEFIATSKADTNLLSSNQNVARVLERAREYRGLK